MSKTYKQKLEANIWKYGLHLVTQKRTYATFIGVYFLTLPNTTAQLLGFTYTVGNLASFLFEIPSGYLSDKLGHKNALVLGKCLLAFATLSYLLANSVWHFVFAAVIWSLALAFNSGTQAAFMHNTLRELKRDDEFAKITGKLHSIGHAIPIALIILLPFLTEVSFRLPFAVALMIDLIGVLTVLSFTSPKRTKAQIEEVSSTNFRQVMKSGWKVSYFRYAIFVALLMGITTAFSSFKDVYMQWHAVPVIYFGVFWGASRVIVSLGSLTNGWIKSTFTFHQFLGLKIVIATLIYALLAFISTPIIAVIAVTLIAAFNWSTTQAEKQYLLEIIGNSSFKATLLSVKSLFYALIRASGVFLLSLWIGIDAYNEAFVTLLIVFVAIALPFYGYLILSHRHTNA